MRHASDAVHPMALYGLLLLLLASPSQAAFTVNDINDLADMADDGLCLTAAGTCSLRAALEEANRCDQPGRTCTTPMPITVLAGHYRLSRWALQIRFPVSITGAGAAQTIIDAQHRSAVLCLPEGDDLWLQDLSIANGNKEPIREESGECFLGGGIHFLENGPVRPQLHLDGVWVYGNFKDGDGGGIYGWETRAYIRNSIIRDNRAGDGFLSHGGGMDVCYLEMENSVVRNNQANGNGGGISIWRICRPGLGRARIWNSVVEGNVAERAGGGLSLLVGQLDYTTVRENDAANGGGLTIKGGRIARSTVAGNSASNAGGGIQVPPYVEVELIAENPAAGGRFAEDLRLTASTISGNSASFGGGVHWPLNTETTLRLESSTIVDNEAETGGGIWSDTGNRAPPNPRNVIARNGGGDCSNVPVLTFSPNHDGDGSCGAPVAGAPGLSGLADHGGPTKTHLPLAGSALIDTGGSRCVARDQRNFASPKDGDGDGSVFCDIGSVEVSGSGHVKTCDDVTPYFGGPWLGPLCLGIIEDVFLQLQIEIPDCFADGPGCWGLEPEAQEAAHFAMSKWGMKWREDLNSWLFEGFDAVDPDYLDVLLPVLEAHVDVEASGQ